VTTPSGDGSTGRFAKSAKSDKPASLMNEEPPPTPNQCANPYATPVPVAKTPVAPETPEVETDVVSPWLCLPSITAMLVLPVCLFYVTFSPWRTLPSFGRFASMLLVRAIGCTAIWCLVFNWYFRRRIVRPLCLVLGALSGASLGFLVLSGTDLFAAVLLGGVVALPGMLGGSVAARTLPTAPLNSDAEIDPTP